MWWFGAISNYVALERMRRASNREDGRLRVWKAGLAWVNEDLRPGSALWDREYLRRRADERGSPSVAFLPRAGAGCFLHGRGVAVATGDVC
jgi:hypothetical protein